MTTEQQVFDLARNQVTDLLTDEELRYTIKVIITAHNAVLDSEFKRLVKECKHIPTAKPDDLVFRELTIVPQLENFNDNEADMYEVFSQQYY